MRELTSSNVLVSIKWIHSLLESNPVNWNILVTGGKERKKSILLVVASEKGIAQTSLWTGVVGPQYKKLQIYDIVEYFWKVKP